MLRRLLALAIVSVLGAVTWPTPDASAAPAYYLSSSLSVPLSDGGCYDCDWCNGGHTWTQRFHPYLDFGFGSPKICGPGLCGYDICDTGGAEDLDWDDMAMVWDAARAGNARALRAMIQAKPSAIWYNHERHAIQFTAACSGDAVVGNIPVDDQVALALD